MPRYLSPVFAIALAACVGSEAPPRGEEPVVQTAESPSTAAVDDRPVVVFLGTSLTAGLGLSNDEDTYVSRIVELADSSGTPIRAVNAGVSGETSAGGLRRLDWVLREPLDVLFLELGANDGLRGQDPAALSQNLTEIIRRTRTRYPGTPVVIAGMQAPPNLGPRYAAAFLDVFPTVASEEAATLVPFLLEGVAGIPELNQADGIHPTPLGHDMLARNAWPVLAEVLERLPAPSS